MFSNTSSSDNERYIIVRQYVISSKCNNIVNKIRIKIVTIKKKDIHVEHTKTESQTTQQCIPSQSAWSLNMRLYTVTR